MLDTLQEFSTSENFIKTFKLGYSDVSKYNILSL